MYILTNGTNVLLETDGVIEYRNGAWYSEKLGICDPNKEFSLTIKEDIPLSITPRQARLALLQATLLNEVELLLANDKAMQIWWEYSLDIQRNHPHIVAMGATLGITELQLDELFILGATL